MSWAVLVWHRCEVSRTIMARQGPRAACPLTMPVVRVVSPLTRPVAIVAYQVV